MPATASDPQLRQRLEEVWVQCGRSDTKAAHLLNLKRGELRRLRVQRGGPIPKVRVRVESALDALGTRQPATPVPTSKKTKTSQKDSIPELARLVLSYALQAVEAEQRRREEEA